MRPEMDPNGNSDVQRKPCSRGRRASCNFLSTNIPQITPDTRRRNSAFSTISLHGFSAQKDGSKLQRLFRRRSNSLTDVNGSLKSRISKFACDITKKDSTKLCQLVVELQGEKYVVTSEHGQSVQDAVESVAMEQKLTSYRIYLASSKALLDLQTDIGSLHNDHIILTDSEDGTNPEDTRYNLVETLLRREKLYQECLRSIFDVYAEPLRKFSSLSTADHRLLFCSLEPILSFSTTLCIKLNDAIQTWDPGTTRIGNLFSKQFWHHYDEYYFRYPAIRSLLKDKYSTDEEFTEFCRMRHGAAHHSLESLLLLPVQRISDYNSFLSRLLVTTDPSHPDYDDLKKALDRVDIMMKDREKQLQNVENEQKMDTVQDRFPNDDLHLQEKDKKNKNPLKRRATAGAVLLKSLSKKHNHQSDKNVPCTSLSSGGDPGTIAGSLPTCDGATKRVYVLEGPVQLTAACQSLDRYLFLFNDLLLIAKQRSSSMYKLKQRIRVSEIWLANCISEVAESCRPHDRSVVIGWPTTNYVATFGSPELMSVWKEKLTKLIAEEKGKEDKTCIIKIRYTDPGGCHACKTLSVTNTEDACSVVSRCIDEFHIQNPELQEYQLWSVSPGKDDPPYPLFGHEIPYAIRKNHEREWGHENGSEMIDSLRGLDLSYFTLQPAKKKPRDLSLDDPRRGKKVKRSPLHGIFRKNQKTSTAPPSGCLFGRSLDEICDGDKLPEPILVILQVLFVQGPYTVGVLRKPGNHKKCQDVKTKLDNGETVTVDELTVPVAASLFKDFLMSLPNCLLGSDLFDQWVATADLKEENQKDQRLNLCKKYIASLSRSQQNLLRHLMCVLHTIASVQMDKDQGMDAYGLAVCIGQSMLWPSPSNSSNMSDVVAKVPSVIQFLIENCEQIFGADSLKIFGELSQEVKPPPDSSTDSDSLHSLLSSLPEQQYVNTRDNSSLDSLERDCYYPEVDSSPQLAKSHLSPTNLSRDSGLTLSDTQLYEECGDNESSTVSTTRKPSYGRSYSQSEDPQPSADPGNLSSSQDSSLLRQSGLPVPPPRKPKRRSGGHEFENNMPLRGMRNCGSASIVSEHKKHYWNASNSRRISDDSTLGSLDEEYPDDLRSTLNLDQYRSGLDIGTLTKSESGAHLYLNDTDVLASENDLQHYSRSSCDHQSKGNLSTDEHHVRHDIKKLGGSLDLPISVAETETESKSLQIHSSLPSGLAASSDVVDGVSNKDGIKNSDFCQPDVYSTQKEHSHQGFNSPRVNDSKSQKVEGDYSELSSQGTSSTPQVQLRNNNLLSRGSVDRAQRAKLIRSDAIDVTTLRKGMTPSGEDRFPTKIPLRTSLYSLDDDSVTLNFPHGSSSGQSKPNQQGASSSQTSCVRKTVNNSCKRSDSCSRLPPSLVRHLQQGTIEKSASDTVISEQFELSGPVRATVRTRPNNPPSYEEAIRRQSQLGHRLHLSEQDIAIQQKNSAKAKKLYEESLKKYETGEIPGCCPPHKQQQNRGDALDTSCHSSQSNQQHPVSRRQPPPYEQACQRAAEKQEHNKHQAYHQTQQEHNKRQTYHQTKYSKYDNSRQLYVESESKPDHVEPAAKMTSERDSKHGLTCPQSFDRYSSAPQIISQVELEQSQVETSVTRQRTGHHSGEANPSAQHRESPSGGHTDSPADLRNSTDWQTSSPVHHLNVVAHQTGSPVNHDNSANQNTSSPARQINSVADQTNLPVHRVNSVAHQKGSPVHRVNSSVHQTGSPIHHANLPVHPLDSSDHSLSSQVNSASSQTNLAYINQECFATNQESKTSRFTVSNQNSSHKISTKHTVKTGDLGRMREPREASRKVELMRESPEQPANKEDTGDHASRHDVSLTEHVSPARCNRARQEQHEGRRRSTSRSRERRSDQRYSDPKLSSSKSALITNLGRSKSDSQEHIDKVNKFKTFKAYENNKENISLEDLSVDEVIGDHRRRAERRPSNEHIRVHGEDSNRRRNVQNSSVLRTTSDQHQNSDSSKSTCRLGVPSSVRNRDWHKELASQYTETFFQPNKLDSTPTKVVKFGYLNPIGQSPKSGEKTKPRWTPPVHPTKDLIYITKDDIHMTESRNVPTHSVKRRNNRSKSQERPISLVSDDVKKLREFSEVETQPQQQHFGDAQNKMVDVCAAGDTTTNTSGINWSVAKLRNLYIGDKVQKERANLTARANNGSNPHFYTPGSNPPPPVFKHEDRLKQSAEPVKLHLQKQHYVKERTNPDAEEAYV